MFYCVLDLTALAQALDSEQAHTSFGKLPMSVEKSQAQYSFPQANRWDGSKKFDAELTKTENIGKNAPGPQYMYDDRIKYAEVSQKYWSKSTLEPYLQEASMKRLRHFYRKSKETNCMLRCC